MPSPVQSRFEKLPGEVRNMIFGFTLLFPERTIDIQKIEHKMPASRSFPERKRRFRKFACVPRGLDVCFSLLRVNKLINAEATQYLYSQNKFLLHATAFEASFRDPSYPSGTTEFLSKLSPEARHAIRNVQLSVSQWFLNSTRWRPMCVYLASEMRMVHFQLIAVCALVDPFGRRPKITAQQTNKSSIKALSEPTHPWIRSLVLIQGLESFSLHADHCGYADSGDEDLCVPEVPEYGDDDDNHHGMRTTVLWWEWEAIYTCFPRAIRDFIREKMGFARS